jgi:hypothetical protein
MFWLGKTYVDVICFVVGSLIVCRKVCVARSPGLFSGYDSNFIKLNDVLFGYSERIVCPIEIW